MTDHDLDHEQGGHDAVDDHDHHGPPPPPEPESPLWLPALGAALFIVAGMYWLLTAGPSPSVAPAQAAESAATAH